MFDNFGGNEMPRSYTGTANLGKSANGTSIMSGPAYGQKYFWAVSSIVLDATALEFDALFKAWDALRATGAAAAVGILDQTFGADVNTNAVFTTPPTYTRMGPNYTMVSFGLTEV